MKKSELRKLIREEIKKLNEINFDELSDNDVLIAQRDFGILDNKLSKRYGKIEYGILHPVVYINIPKGMKFNFESRYNYAVANNSIYLDKKQIEYLLKNEWIKLR